MTWWQWVATGVGGWTIVAGLVLALMQAAGRGSRMEEAMAARSARELLDGAESDEDALAGDRGGADGAGTEGAMTDDRVNVLMPKDRTNVLRTILVALDAPREVNELRDSVVLATGATDARVTALLGLLARTDVLIVADGVVSLTELGHTMRTL